MGEYKQLNLGTHTKEKIQAAWETIVKFMGETNLTFTIDNGFDEKDKYRCYLKAYSFENSVIDGQFHVVSSELEVRK